MRGIFAFIICFVILGGCSNNRHSNATPIEGSDIEKFDSFLTQFAQYGNKPLDYSFFELRKQFKDEKWCPEINKFIFLTYLPFYESRNDEKDFCYRPCYKIERNNFYIISINREYYSYDDNILATYNKEGGIIDKNIVGISDGANAYKIEPSTDENEITYTQYYFSDVESAAFSEGDCNICVYKVKIDNNGKIEKSLLREEKNVKVKL